MRLAEAIHSLRNASPDLETFGHVNPSEPIGHVHFPEERADRY